MCYYAEGMGSSNCLPSEWQCPARLALSQATDSMCSKGKANDCHHRGFGHAEGRGSLKDAHTVEVALSSGGTRTLTADKILLAVGDKPVKAPIVGSVGPLTPVPPGSGTT